MRVASERASGEKPKAKSSCESQKRFPYWIGRGPGQQRLPAVLLTYRVLLEIGLLLVKDKEEEEGSRYKEKEIRGRLEVLVLEYGSISNPNADSNHWE